MAFHSRETGGVLTFWDYLVLLWPAYLSRQYQALHDGVAVRGCCHRKSLMEIAWLSYFALGPRPRVLVAHRRRKRNKEENDDS